MRHVSARSWLITIAAVLAMGCASERHAVPPVGTLVTPSSAMTSCAASASTCASWTREAIRPQRRAGRDRRGCGDLFAQTRRDPRWTRRHPISSRSDPGVSYRAWYGRVERLCRPLEHAEGRGEAGGHGLRAVRHQARYRRPEERDQAGAKALEDALPLLLHHVDRMGVEPTEKEGRPGRPSRPREISLPYF